MKTLILAVMILFSQLAVAKEEPLVCENKKEVSVYTYFLTEKAQSYKIPAGYLAVVDIIIRPIEGPFILSGRILTKAGKTLTSSEGAKRWFLDMRQWVCMTASDYPLMASNL